jgi:murein DD-endopeptidase MepM/ murein hydrolase activator NlpD
LDDRTGKSILILAPVDLIILTAYQGWTPDSRMRGGQYIWGADTSRGLLYYFAHLDKIIVEPGQFVSKGTVIASLGRSGKNAYQTRSPTHLHLMLLKVEGTNVHPINFYSKLSNARIIQVP